MIWNTEMICRISSVPASLRMAGSRIWTILRQTEALYAGGSLSPQDEAAFYDHMMEIFMKAKARNAARFAARQEMKETEG